MTPTLKWHQVQVDLKHAFTIAHGSSNHRTNLVLEFIHEEIVGLGLAAPNPRYGETPASTEQAFQTMAQRGLDSPWRYRQLLERVDSDISGSYAAKAALDMAIQDWIGKKLGAPLYQIWGINPETMPPTSMTIGIDNLDTVKRKVLEVPHFEVLKIKLDGKHDRDLIGCIRDVSSQTLRVDANEGWVDREKAAREIEWLASQGVELVEQPMPAHLHEDMAWLKPRSALPLIADESFHGSADVTALAREFHGINIKLMKCGGLQQAKAWITLARYHQLQIMLGCMVASSLAIAAAGQLAPMVDFVDLDGHLLIKNDPFQGLGLEQGRLQLSSAPGLGIWPFDTH